MYNPINLINLTPHPITFYYKHKTNNTPMLTIEPSGLVARLSTETKEIGSYIHEDGVIPITKTVYGPIENLPEPDGNYYIVSSLVAQQCKHRMDVFIPNESVRDDNGQIIGCLSLGRI